MRDPATDFSLPEPAPPLTLLGAVNAALGDAALIDMSFPLCRLGAISGEEPTLALLCPRAAAERDFLMRFRQRGGHAPLVVVDPSAPSGSWPPSGLPPGDHARRAVAFVSSLADAGQIALAVREHGGGLLIPADDTSEDVPRTFEAFGFATRKLAIADGGPELWFCMPRSTLPLAAALGASGRTASRPEPVAQSHVLHHAEGEARPVIPARLLVHDGAYPSEGDLSYSWLWTGPDAHFRLIIPRMDRRRPSRIEISIIRSEDPTNLDRLVVMLDGCPVPYLFDRWSNSSGKAVIDLPDTDDYTIVSLVVPKMAKDAHGDRLLGLCIDKLILIP